MVEIVRENVKINNFRAKKEGDLGDVVKFVDWTYYWTHSDYPGAKIESAFITALPEANADDFVEFYNITKDILIDWVLSVESANLDKIELFAMEQMPYEYAISQTTIYYIGEE